MHQFREPTRFIDSNDEAIRSCVRGLIEPGDDEHQRAIRIFEFVRDKIAFEFTVKLHHEDFEASRILKQRRGFCVQKAVLLCALGRAAKIPSALVMSDLRDHTLPPHLVEIVGTNVLHHHGLVAFYLGGKWVKVDAALSPDVVSAKGYYGVIFDGISDALMPQVTQSGEPHTEYLEFHGLYPDLPFRQMIEAFVKAYRDSDVSALEKAGYPV